MHTRRLAPFALALSAVMLVALGTGVGYAGGLITGQQIAKNAITSPKIKDGTIKVKDLSKAAKKRTQGPAGPAGADGADGERGVSAWDVIPSGKTVSGGFYHTGRSGSVVRDITYVKDLPALAPDALNTVGYGSDSVPATVTDPTCNGGDTAPTAPPGKLCIYFGNVSQLSPTATPVAAMSALYGRAGWFMTMTESAPNTNWSFRGAWAYTAP